MKYLLKLILVLLVCTSCQSNSDSIKVELTVNTQNNLSTMAGGMGASWHAISKDFPLENEKYSTPVREEGSRGSAFGGNPPVSSAEAWAQLASHASWLGLNFVRVELSQRMYNLEKDIYDWENEEMQALYNILDWAQANGVDVFLQQMWMYADWNSIPGIHPIISAPNDLDEFANSITTLIEYLTNEKGYTCIKYFCMVNEPPGGTWGYWWNEGSTENTTSAGWKRLKEEFDNRDIAIPISGPDWTDMPIFDAEKLDFAKSLGAIDIHSYHGVTDQGEANLKKWAEWSHANNKPFFLTEYGNMNLGWGADDPNQKSFDAAISNACDVMRGLRAGVDGFNRWSYTNRGDLDGQWQLVQTYDRDKKEYLNNVELEKEAYFGFGIISRFLSKYSSVVSCSANQPDSVIMAQALVSPAGELSIFIVNPSDKTLIISLDVCTDTVRDLNLYQVSKDLLSKPDFKLNASMSFKSDTKKEITVPARSITTLSSYLLEDSHEGIFVK